MAKGTTSRTLVFLISDKKRNLKIAKNGHFEKKGNFREPVAKFDTSHAKWNFRNPVAKLISTRKYDNLPTAQLLLHQSGIIEVKTTMYEYKINFLNF